MHAQFLKFYSSTVRQFAVLLEQIRDGLFPEWKTPPEYRLYAAAMKKTEKLMLPLLIAMRRIGQAQLLRKIIANELHFRSKLDANVLHNALGAFDEVSQAHETLTGARERGPEPSIPQTLTQTPPQSLVNDIRKHYRDDSNPIPSESNAVLEQTSTLLDSNGSSDPLQKVYITTDPLEGLPVLLMLFTTAYAQKLKYSTDFGTLVRVKASYPLDGWPLVVGMGTLLKQCHPSYAQALLSYQAQFCRASIIEVTKAQAAAGKSAASLQMPREVTNTLVFAKTLAEVLSLDPTVLHQHIPQYLMQNLTVVSDN